MSVFIYESRSEESSAGDAPVDDTFDEMVPPRDMNDILLVITRELLSIIQWLRIPMMRRCRKTNGSLLSHKTAP